MKRKILISVLIILIVSIVCVGFYTKNKLVKKSTIKKINVIENNSQSKIIIEEVLKREKDFDKFLSTTEKDNVDMNFENFFRYILNEAEKIKGQDLDLDEFGKCINPKTDLFNFQINDVLVTEINYDYLNKKYLKYLSPAWQNFMKLVVNNKEKFLSSAGVNAKYSEIVDWIISWQNFQKEYPDFPMNDYIGNELKYLTAYGIMLNKYTFEYTEDNSMAEQYKQGYEDFLNRVNKDIKEYYAVKKCYEILKKNNFKENKAFDDAFIEYAGIEYYKFIKE